MKRFLGVIAAFILGAAIVASTQSYGAFGFGPIAPAVAQCPLSTVGNVSLCAVGTSAANYQLYVSYSTGAYLPLVPAVTPSSGVTSFNKRTGDITLTAADVTGTGIAATTVVTSTSTATTTLK